MAQYAEYNGQTYDLDNAYDKAAMEWESAKARLQIAKKLAARLVEKAQEDADNAERELAKYELAPGLPDPKFLPFQQNGKTMADILDETDLKRNGR